MIVSLTLAYYSFYTLLLALSYDCLEVGLMNQILNDVFVGTEVSSTVSCMN